MPASNTPKKPTPRSTSSAPAARSASAKKVDRKVPVRKAPEKAPQRIQNTKKFYDPDRTLHKVMPFLLALFGIALGICLVADVNGASGGLVGHYLTVAFGGLFAAGVYALPAVVVLHGLFWKQDVRNRCVFARALYSLVALTVLGAILQTVASPIETLAFDAAAFFRAGSVISGGGLFGASLAWALYRLVGTTCLWVVLVLALLLYVASFLDFKAIVASYKERKANPKPKREPTPKKEAEEPKEEKPHLSLAARRKIRRAAIQSDDTYYYDQEPAESFDAIKEKLLREEAREATLKHAAMEPAPSPAPGIEIVQETITPAAVPSAPIRQTEPVTSLNDSDDALRMLDRHNRIRKGKEPAADKVTVASAPSTSSAAEPAAVETPADIEAAEEKGRKKDKSKNKISIKSYEMPKPAGAELRKEAQKPGASSPYQFPPIDLLKPGKTAVIDHEVEEEIARNSELLIDTLASFRVDTHMVGTSRGPRITRYEILPNKGVKISSIVNRIDDIALNLASAGIRIEAPIPGMAAVGVEVPNRKASIVRFRDLVSSEEFITAPSKATICLGTDVTGKPVFADVSKMPHLLIAGATGMGKSVCINAILLSLLYKARPDEVKLILVDPKKVELNVYNNIPHLLVPVVTEPQAAAGALLWAVGEMERRFELIEHVAVRDINGYNKAVAADPSLGEPLPKIIIVIDELNDLMMSARDAVEASICRIAQKARAAGMHLIIGTQRPSVDVITGVIKANIPSRIAFHVSSQIDSRTILDASGADKLLDKGDMLAALVGLEPRRIQGSMVEDEEVENVTNFLKENAKLAGMTYDSEVMENIQHETEKYKQSNSKRGDRDEDDEPISDDILDDPKFRQACEVALSAGKISTSLLQRKMSVGFGKASKYIDAMEDFGIVGPLDGQKPREVLMSYDEYMTLVARRD